MATKKEKVHSFWTIVFEEKDIEGVRHLREDLDYKEAKVFFEFAHQNGSADFEDDEERQWTLTYKGSEGAYYLVRRQS